MAVVAAHAGLSKILHGNRITSLDQHPRRKPNLFPKTPDWSGELRTATQDGQWGTLPLKREAKLLLDKACDSLLLGIELFNRPSDRGRVSAVLIQTDHSFEMFLKAAILQRGGKIRENTAKETIGFDACVRRGLSDGRLKFLTEEQALTLQTINGLRDAAQHHLLDISEAHLYIHIQSGVTLFRDLFRLVFARELYQELPARVLPISTMAPVDISTIFDSEITEILKLLQPGRRRSVEAEARMRPLAVLESTINGEKTQPSAGDLDRIGRNLLKRDWREVFPGAAVLNVVTEGAGADISVRITKQEGPGFHIVPEGTPGSSTVAVRRVNELDYYNLNTTQLADKAEITTPKLLAVITHLGIQDDPDCFKEIAIGKARYKRYSQKVIPIVRQCLETEDLAIIWENRPKSMRKSKS